MNEKDPEQSTLEPQTIPSEALKRIEESLALLRRGPRRMERGDRLHKRSHERGEALGAHAGQSHQNTHTFGHAAKFRMLGALTKNDASTVSELAEIIGVDQPRASRLAIDLEAQGLLNKRQDPKDARRTVISITAKGTEFLQEVTSRRKQATMGALAGFSEAETEQFANLLSRFVGNLATKSGS